MRKSMRLFFGLLTISLMASSAQGGGPAVVAFNQPAQAARAQRGSAQRVAAQRVAAQGGTAQGGAAQGGAAQGGAAQGGPNLGGTGRQGGQLGPLQSTQFNSFFNSYRGFQTGRPGLQTAESGQAEMATSEISAGEPTQGFEMGGIPGRQVRRRRPGVGRSLSGSGAWFNAGSPFGIRYGYGSGYGYGGYGFDSPYGYGSRTGSGGAYGFGFGAFGSVGGQTGERLSSLISGPVEEGGRLIGPEPAGMGAPARLESSQGGTYGRAGAGVRRLGGSASGGSGSGSGGAGD